MRTVFRVFLPLISQNERKKEAMTRKVINWLGVHTKGKQSSCVSFSPIVRVSPPQTHVGGIAKTIPCHRRLQSCNHYMHQQEGRNKRLACSRFQFPDSPSLFNIFFLLIFSFWSCLFARSSLLAFEKLLMHKMSRLMVKGYLSHWFALSPPLLIETALRFQF